MPVQIESKRLAPIFRLPLLSTCSHAVGFDGAFGGTPANGHVCPQRGV